MTTCATTTDRGRSGEARFGSPSKRNGAHNRRPIGAPGQPDRDRGDRAGRLHRQLLLQAAAGVDPVAVGGAAGGHVRPAAGALQAVLLQGPEAARDRQAAPSSGSSGAAQLRAGPGRRLPGDLVGVPAAGSGDRSGYRPSRRCSRVRQSAVRLLPGMPDLLPAWQAGIDSRMNTQLWALAAAGTVLPAAPGLDAYPAAPPRRLSPGTPSARSAEPYLLCFT